MFSATGSVEALAQAQPSRVDTGVASELKVPCLQNQNGNPSSGPSREADRLRVGAPRDKARPNLIRVGLVVMTITALAAFAQNGGDDSVNRTIDKLLGDHRKYQRVILALQKAVINHAAAGVAAFVSYPIGVKLDGKTTIIRTPKAFIRDCDRIITPAIAGVIEQ